MHLRIIIFSTLFVRMVVVISVMNAFEAMAFVLGGFQHMLLTFSAACYPSNVTVVCAVHSIREIPFYPCCARVSV